MDRPVEDQFYGDRSGTLIDPFGHKRTLATCVREVSAEEMQRHMAEWAGQGEEAQADTAA